MRVAVVDDHPLFREGVTNALSAESDLVIVGEGASVEDAVRLANTLHPEVMVLDLALPDGGGIFALGQVCEASPATRVVILTFDTAQDRFLAALSAGATSYVLKGVTARELAAIVRAAGKGQGYVPPELAAQALQVRVGRPTLPGTALDALTAREMEILKMVRDGLTNSEIAQTLCLAETTVKNSMTTIMQKLQVRNRVEAAVLAYRESLSSHEHMHAPSLHRPL